MKKMLLAVSLLAAAVSVARADPAEDRENMMKAFGKQVGTLAPYAKGEKEFDAAAIQASFKALDEASQKFDAEALFPKGDLGESASPKIWEDWDGFKAAVDKYKADVSAAAASAPADLDAFKASFGKVTSNCGSCHETFRVKKG